MLEAGVHWEITVQHSDEFDFSESTMKPKQSQPATEGELVFLVCTPVIKHDM